MSRFCHSHSSDPLTRNDLIQISTALLSVGAVVKVVHEKHTVGQIGKAETRIVLGKLMVDNDSGERIHTGTTIVSGDSDSVETEVTLQMEKRVRRLRRRREGKRGNCLDGKKYTYHLLEELGVEGSVGAADKGRVSTKRVESRMCKNVQECKK